MRILRQLLQLLDANLHRRTPRLVQKLAHGASSDEVITPNPTPPRTIASIKAGVHQTHLTRSHPVKLAYSSVFTTYEIIPDLPVPPNSQSKPSDLSISTPQVPPPSVYVVDPVTWISYPEPPTPVPFPRITNDARSYLDRVIQNPGVLHPRILPKLEETEEEGVFYYFAICDAVVAGKT